jgi:DNA-binding MarR family transcriptional regulator
MQVQTTPPKQTTATISYISTTSTTTVLRRPGALGKKSIRVLEILDEEASLTSVEIAKKMKKSKRNYVRAYLYRLEKSGYVERHICDNEVIWNLTEGGRRSLLLIKSNIPHKSNTKSNVKSNTKEKSTLSHRSNTKTKKVKDDIDKKCGSSHQSNTKDRTYDPDVLEYTINKTLSNIGIEVGVVDNASKILAWFVNKKLRTNDAAIYFGTKSLREVLDELSFQIGISSMELDSVIQDLVNAGVMYIFPNSMKRPPEKIGVKAWFVKEVKKALEAVDA